MAMELGNYQQTKSNGTVDGVTLKYLLVNANASGILSYFSSPFNKDVAPGSVIWTPDLGQYLPWQSPQLFADELDLETLTSKTVRIEGLQDVTTTYLTATTTDNSRFGIVAGQSVEILVIIINQNISTDLMTSADIDASIESLATMTTDLANLTELLRRIQSFFSQEAMPDSPTTPGGRGSRASVRSFLSPLVLMSLTMSLV